MAWIIGISAVLLVAFLFKFFEERNKPRYERQPVEPSQPKPEPTYPKQPPVSAAAKAQRKAEQALLERAKKALNKFLETPVESHRLAEFEAISKEFMAYFFEGDVLDVEAFEALYDRFALIELELSQAQGFSAKDDEDEDNDNDPCETPGPAATDLVSTGQRSQESSSNEDPIALFENPLSHIDFDRFDEQFTEEQTKTYDNGDRYVGNWENGNRHGLGKYYFASSKAIHLGYWEKGVRQGFGIHRWISGNTYYGPWVNNKMEGWGYYAFVVGDRYVGQFKQDNRHGKGTYYYKNGDRYEGDWLDGQRTGQGRYYYHSNGRIHEGGFYESKLHGSGRIIYPDGRIEEGIWDMGTRK